MPVIRFVREGRDVECYPGENLREVARREGIELYGLKGQLGNCGGCGQCITCFVSVVDEDSADALTARTAVEDSKLRRRPQEWRLACQALVEKSVMVLPRPQVRLANADSRLLSNTVVALTKMKVGQILPWHVDRCKTYISKNNIKDKTKIARIIVFLEDSKPGHQLWIEDQLCTGEAGSCFGWMFGTKHMAANLGEQDRYTLQITGVRD